MNFGAKMGQKSVTNKRKRHISCREAILEILAQTPLCVKDLIFILQKGISEFLVWKSQYTKDLEPVLQKAKEYKRYSKKHILRCIKKLKEEGKIIEYKGFDKEGKLCTFLSIDFKPIILDVLKNLIVERRKEIVSLEELHSLILEKYKWNIPLDRLKADLFSALKEFEKEKWKIIEELKNIIGEEYWINFGVSGEVKVLIAFESKGIIRIYYGLPIK